MADHVEDRPIALVGRGDPSSGGGRPGRVFQVRSIECHQLEQAAEIERGAMQRHVFSCQVKFPNQKIEDLVADIGSDLETDCLVEPPSTELHFNGLEQVVGFFVFNRQVTIAAHAERCPVLNDHADEESVELGTDHQFGEAGTDRANTR